MRLPVLVMSLAESRITERTLTGCAPPEDWYRQALTKPTKIYDNSDILDKESPKLTRLRLSTDNFIHMLSQKRLDWSEEESSTKLLRSYETRTSMTFICDSEKTEGFLFPDSTKCRGI
jgi:hypothetical protein